MSPCGAPTSVTEKAMQEFSQQVISGIASGGIFASLALALVLIYNEMGLVNFAQGEMAMMATFVAFTLISRGVRYWRAFPLTLAIAFAGGILVQRIVIRPVERAPLLTLVIITLGLATLFNGLAGAIFGYVPRSFPSPFSVETVNILGAFVSYRDLGVIAVSGAVLLLIYLLLQRTTVGLTMRAAAHHPEASRLLGVHVSWMLALGWGLASAVGAVSGIMVAPIILLEPNMMQTIIIYAFAAAVLGGIESPLGAGLGDEAPADPAAALVAGACRRPLFHRIADCDRQLSVGRVGPGPGPRDSAHGPEHPGRIQRPAVDGPRRVHGSRRLHVGHPGPSLQNGLPVDDSHRGARHRDDRLSVRRAGSAALGAVPGARHFRARGRDAEPDQTTGRADRRGAGNRPAAPRPTPIRQGRICRSDRRADDLRPVDLLRHARLDARSFLVGLEPGAPSSRTRDASAPRWRGCRLGLGHQHRGLQDARVWHLGSLRGHRGLPVRAGGWFRQPGQLPGGPFDPAAGRHCGRRPRLHPRPAPGRHLRLLPAHRVEPVGPDANLDPRPDRIDHREGWPCGHLRGGSDPGHDLRPERSRGPCHDRLHSYAPEIAGGPGSGDWTDAVRPSDCLNTDP